jgi:hypothetical protein
MTMFIDQFNDGEELLNLAFFFIKFSLLLRYFPPHQLLQYSRPSPFRPSYPTTASAAFH